MLDFIKINHDDKVAVALHPLTKGTILNVDGEEITLAEDIPQAHKFALKDIREGEPVIKYGLRIGFAKEDIPKGAWIHVHNIRTALGEKLEYKYEPEIPVLKPTEHVTFRGYRRKDGRAGIRNDIWILPTVGCVNSVVKAMEQEAREKFALGNSEEGVEDIFCFNHPYGCSQMGDDQENTRKVLAGIIHHPNAAGVLVVGLGCENSNIPVLMDYIGEYDPERIKFLVCQDFEDENEEAMKRLGNPGRFGYPVLVILDEDGHVMHIQNSSYLEEEKSYSHKKVLDFFQNWTREAIDNLK